MKSGRREDERKQLFDWIECDVFETRTRPIPTPVASTLRRLNRVEYRNTIRDLMGVDYDTSSEFPADDAGYGFDNIGAAMSMSPLVMEKYLNAARAIVAKAVPSSPPDKDDRDAQARYRRFFVKGPPTDDRAKRETYAREILGPFVHRAYRRPVDDATVERLVEIAKEAWMPLPQQSFENGIAAAMTAVLASPRFLFRVEEAVANSSGERHPLVDEYSLASRLSYFLWSTMPDDELIRLAERGELRTNLPEQIAADAEGRPLVGAGRKLRRPVAAGPRHRALRYRPDRRARPATRIGRTAAADVPHAQERERLRNSEGRDRDRTDRERDGDRRADDPEREKRWQERERIRAEFRRLKAVGRHASMTSCDRRCATKREEYFAYVLRENRDVLELVDSNYTFLNETLAKHYGIDGVEGDEMRRVELPTAARAAAFSRRRRSSPSHRTPTAHRP